MSIRRTLSGALIFAVTIFGLQALPIEDANAACRTLPKSKGVETGDETAYAWSNSGLAYSWGRGDNGARGDGSKTTKKNYPTRVKLSTKVVKVSSFASHALFLGANGNVFSTGVNEYGQLGMGNTKTLWTPKQISGLTCVKDIEVGRYNSFALKTDGSVWAWGLIYLPGIESSEPVIVKKPTRLKGLSKISKIYAGGDVLIAYGSSATYSFGTNENAQLGDGWDTDTNVQPVVNPLHLQPAFPYSQISISDGEVLGVSSDYGQITGWGQSELPSPYNVYRVVSVPTRYFVTERLKSVALGRGHALGLSNDGVLFSWGNNKEGALGSHHGLECDSGDESLRASCSGSGFGSYLVSRDTTSILDKVQSAVAGNYSNVALRTDGSVWTWGDGEFGQLGTRTRIIYGYFGSSRYESFDVPQKIYGLNLNK